MELEVQLSTTAFARDYLPRIARLIHFLNADLISRECLRLRPGPRRHSGVSHGRSKTSPFGRMRRFERGWTNLLDEYQPLADHSAIYENSEFKLRKRERGP